MYVGAGSAVLAILMDLQVRLLGPLQIACLVVGAVASVVLGLIIESRTRTVKRSSPAIVPRRHYR